MPLSPEIRTSLETLLRAIARSKYATSKSVNKLTEILGLCAELQFKLDELKTIHTRELASNDVRGIALFSRTCTFHEIAIRQRLALVTRMNEQKARKIREDRRAANILTEMHETGVIGQLISRNKQLEHRLENRERDQATEQAAVQASVSPMIAKLKEQGFDLSLSKDERDKQYALAKQGMPDTNLAGQGQEIIDKLLAAEDERAAEIEAAQPAQPNLDVSLSDIANDKTKADDTSTIGSPDEWSKLI
jgi:hypothetical protein